MDTSKILASIDAEIERLQRAKEILAGVNEIAPRRPGRPGKSSATPIQPKRRLSAEARARIAAAQKARWAKVRKTTKS